MPLESFKSIKVVETRTLNPAPNVESYSKELDDTIKYVQYLPKGYKNQTIEEAVNQIYHDKHFID